MASLDKAPRRNYNSVYNWMYHNAPLAKAEAEFIKQDEDFVALVKTKEMGWFDGFVEDCLSMFPTKPTRVRFLMLPLTTDTLTPVTVSLLYSGAARQYRRQAGLSLQQEAYRHVCPSHHHHSRRRSPHGSCCRTLRL